VQEDQSIMLQPDNSHILHQTVGAASLANSLINSFIAKLILREVLQFQDISLLKALGPFAKQFKAWILQTKFSAVQSTADV